MKGSININREFYAKTREALSILGFVALMDLIFAANLDSKPYVYRQGNKRNITLAYGQRFIKMKQWCKEYNIGLDKITSVLAELKSGGYVTTKDLYDGKVRRGYIITLQCLEEALFESEGALGMPEEDEEPLSEAPSNPRLDSEIPLLDAPNPLSVEPFPLLDDQNPLFPPVLPVIQSSIKESSIQYTVEDGSGLTASPLKTEEKFTQPQEPVKLMRTLYQIYQQLEDLPEDRKKFFTAKAKTETLNAYAAEFFSAHVEPNLIDLAQAEVNAIKSGAKVITFPLFLKRLTEKAASTVKTKTKTLAEAKAFKAKDFLEAVEFDLYYSHNSREVEQALGRLRVLISENPEVSYEELSKMLAEDPKALGCLNKARAELLR